MARKIFCNYGWKQVLVCLPLPIRLQRPRLTNTPDRHKNCLSYNPVLPASGGGHLLLKLHHLRLNLVPGYILSFIDDFLASGKLPLPVFLAATRFHHFLFFLKSIAQRSPNLHAPFLHSSYKSLEQGFLASTTLLLS